MVHYTHGSVAALDAFGLEKTADDVLKAILTRQPTPLPPQRYRTALVPQPPTPNALFPHLQTGYRKTQIPLPQPAPFNPSPGVGGMAHDLYTWAGVKAHNSKAGLAQQLVHNPSEALERGSNMFDLAQNIGTTAYGALPPHMRVFG